MKTLNRTLSLVLVLVMVLGLFGVASAKFNDDAEIQYKEAVGVLTGIGAIDGMGDGTFAPKGTLTRAQAAKLVAYTILGKDIAKTLPVKASSFKDVGADLAWAIPSIEYLVNRGIVSGLGDGTFAPNGNVTSNQFAKMLLVALGIKGEFTGESWELNTAIAANKAGIFKDAASTDRTKPATREEAALYCFNALFYGEKSTATVSKYLVTATAVPDAGIAAIAGVTQHATFAAAMTEGTTAGGVYGNTFTISPITVTEETVKDSIADDVYGLTKVTTGVVDNVGRPATKYVIDGKAIATFAKAPVATFTGSFTQAQLYNALGTATSVPAVVYNGTTTAGSATLTAAVGVQNRQGGNGVLTEVFKTGTNTYTAIQVAPIVDTVTGITKVPATATKGAYTRYTVTAGSFDVFSTVVNKTADVDTAVVSGDVSIGDKVLVYVDGATPKVAHISTLATMEGVLSSISSTGVYTIDGKPYQLAAAGTAPSVSTSKQVFYVDSYGYILGTKSASSTTNYGAVIDYRTTYTMNPDNTLSPAYLLTVVKADGTVAELPVSSTEYGDWDSSNEIFKLVTYTSATDAITGKVLYDLTDASSAGAKVSTVTGITNKTNALAKSGGGVAYADAATLFIAVNYNPATNKPTGTVNTYTGIANVPSYTGLLASWAVDTNVTDDTVANVVFIVDNKSTTATDSYAYLTGSYTTTTSGIALDAIVGGEAKTFTVSPNFASLTTTATAFTVVPDETTFDAITNKTTLFTKTSNTYTRCASSATWDGTTTYYTFDGYAALKGLYSTFTVSSGVISDATAATPVPSANGIKVSGNLLSTTANNGTNWTVFTTAHIGDAVPVYVLHTVSGTVDKLTASAVTTLTNASAVYVSTSAGANVGVYVTYAN